MERIEILERFYKLREEKQDFYKRHPELLEQLNEKIKALETGGYKIVNGSWVIAYIGSKIADEQMYTNLEKRNKKNYTIDNAKATLKEFETYDVFKINK